MGLPGYSIIIISYMYLNLPKFISSQASKFEMEGYSLPYFQDFMPMFKLCNSCDIRFQSPPLFSCMLKKSGSLGMRLHIWSFILDCSQMPLKTSTCMAATQPFLITRHSALVGFLLPIQKTFSHLALGSLTR